MQLKEIIISNYKSFGTHTDATSGKISDLSELNLIFGHNSSGKSNILNFLDLLFSKKISRESIFIEGEDERRIREESGPFWRGTITNEPYIFHKNIRSTPVEFSVSLELNKLDLEKSGFTEFQAIIDAYFANNESVLMTFTGEITSSGDYFTSIIKLTKVDLNKLNIFIDDGEARTYFDGIANLVGERQIFENLLGIFNETVLFLDKDRYLISEKENLSLNKLTPHSLKNWIYNLSLNNFKYNNYLDFLDFVRKYGSAIDIFKTFDPSFSKNINTGEIDVFISNGSERLPLKSFGTGIQQLLLLLATLFETNAKIILIEELELNLSPESQQLMLQVFLNLLDDKTIDQILFTSHSKILASTPKINVYEVTIDNGISNIAPSTATTKNAFFKRDTKIDKQMRSVLRDPKHPGPEWE